MLPCKPMGIMGDDDNDDDELKFLYLVSVLELVYAYQGTCQLSPRDARFSFRYQASHWLEWRAQAGFETLDRLGAGLKAPSNVSKQSIDIFKHNKTRNIAQLWPFVFYEHLRMVFGVGT